MADRPRRTNPGAKRARVTIRDVAEAAGVTPSTVSRAFGRPELISAETRARVHAVADRLSYRPNALAGALTTKRTLLLGLVTSDIQNPFVAALARGVQDHIRTSRYLSIICSTDADPDTQLAMVEEMRLRGIDGFILTPTEGAPSAAARRYLASLPAQGVPLVFVGEPQVPDADNVTSNAEAGAVAAIEHLVALGHSDIGYIGGRFSKGVALGRWRGFQRGVAAHALSPLKRWTVESGTTHESGERVAAKMLAAGRRPSALLTANDLIAFGAMRACNAAGLSIPGDISIVGFDDIPVAAMVHPPLTTVAQPAYELGASAAELLLERLAEPSRERRTRELRCELMVRASTGPSRGPG